VHSQGSRNLLAPLARMDAREAVEWGRAWDLAARTCIQGGTLPGGTRNCLKKGASP